MKSNFDVLFTARFPKFGTNKIREIMRLNNKISKIENLSDMAVLYSIKENYTERTQDYD